MVFFFYFQNKHLISTIYCQLRDQIVGILDGACYVCCLLLLIKQKTILLGATSRLDINNINGKLL